MNNSQIGYRQLHNWWNNGLSFWKLNASDVTVSSSLREAIESLLIGLLCTLIIEMLVLVNYIPKTLFTQFLGLPLYAFVIIFNMLFFVLMLWFALWILRTNHKPRIVSSIACYRLSGAIPLVMLFSGEQLSEAIRLFIVHRDIGLPYMHTAAYNLLFPEQASNFALARSWCFFLLQILVFVTYLLWGISKTLIEVSSGSPKSVRITIAVVVACVLDILWVNTYSGRLYWWLMAGLSRG